MQELVRYFASSAISLNVFLVLFQSENQMH